MIVGVKWFPVPGLERDDWLLCIQFRIAVIVHRCSHGSVPLVSEVSTVFRLRKDKQVIICELYGRHYLRRRLASEGKCRWASVCLCVFVCP